MKAIVLILLIALCMTLSFLAIGTVMLFALDVVEDWDDLYALATGVLPGGESGFLKPGEVAKLQEAIRLLRQQKEDLERDLQSLKDKLAGSEVPPPELPEAPPEPDPEREKRIDQTAAIIAKTRPADAAALLDWLDDDLVLDILFRLEDAQAARTLSALGDDQRKAKLMTQFVEGQKQP